MFLSALGEQLLSSAVATNRNITGTLGSIRTGTNAADFFDSRAGETLVGGLGDDSYNLWDANFKITEKAGGGIDTAYARFWGGMVLPDNVENLYLMTAGSNWGTGNALNNVIVAGSINTTLDGAGGNDVLVGGAGADIFKIAAGNGSDAIVNFRPGWDVIKLAGYGFEDFAALKANAVQTQSDVTIKLSSTEMLVIRDVKLADLSAVDFDLPMTPTAPGAAISVLDQASTAWNANGWYVVNNAWGVADAGLTWGKDAQITAYYSKADMTDGTTFTWSVPVTNSLYPAILAYPEVIFGISPLNTIGVNPTDTKHVFPVRVGDLTKLTATQDVSFSGNVSGFNVSYDIWLTSTKNGDASTITNEVMIWVHKGAFEAFGSQIGTYTSPEGYTAKIYHKDTYTAVIFDKDLPKAEIDIAGVLKTLETLKVVSANEYIGSIELGAEVVSGQGKLVINNLDLTVSTRNADGSETVKVVTGTGTTVTTIEAPAPAEEPKPVEEPTNSVPLPPAPVLELPDSYKAGTTTWTDAFGNKLTTKTVLNAPDTATLTVYNALGKVTAIDEVQAIESGVKVTHYSGARQLLGSTVTQADADGSTLRTRYDPHGQKLESVRSFFDSEGAVIAKFFDAAGKMLGWESEQTTADALVIKRYDENSKLTGAEKIFGNVVQHLDGNLTLVGIDKTIANANGTKTIQHFDGKSVLQSYDTVKVADSAVTTYHYTTKGVLTGIHVDRLDSGDIVKSIDLDAKWNALNATLTGTALDDRLGGATYATEFHGGLGSDRISCGSGVDTIVFDTLIGYGDVDTISAFKSRTDKLVLDRDIFSALESNGPLSNNEFIIGAKALTADQHIIYDRTNASLYYDADGNGSGGAVLFAQLVNGTTLALGDFVVIG